VRLFFESTPQSHIAGLHTYKTVDADHGRIEEREVTSCNNIDWLIKDHPYPHLASIISVNLRRFVANKWSQETRCFISSISHNDAEKYAHYIRAHWGVENSLHKLSGSDTV
jgi:predicted transposase YbfD/YdcC